MGKYTVNFTHEAIPDARPGDEIELDDEFAKTLASAVIPAETSEEPSEDEPAEEPFDAPAFISQG